MQAQQNKFCKAPIPGQGMATPVAQGTAKQSKTFNIRDQRISESNKDIFFIFWSRDGLGESWGERKWIG
jgi:hypothetical protein